MKIIGMDLGTSSTYLYGVNSLFQEERNAAVPTPVVVPGISDDKGSIATVVMYEDENPFLAGNIAESEFYANISQKPRRRLSSQFKPEIAQGSAGAMRAMTDFLSLLKTGIGDGILEDDTLLYVGMPSLAREDFSINMKKCFVAAGWPKPHFVRESDAALISCLQSGALGIDDIDQNCLILDFGGGTFDYTSVQGMDALQNGGDTLYGGRLFDDLIFQAFAAHDSLFARGIANSPYEWYVHWIECKSQKEKFSDFLASQKSSSPTNSKAPALSLHVLWYDASGERHDAFLPDYGEEIFIQNAENYQASPQMLRVLEGYSERGGLSVEARDLLESRKIGLISWLRSILLNVAGRAEITRIILTGGSARWFFVMDLVKKIFPQAQCIRSKRGFEDIAFGLALYPALSRSREKVKKLLEEKLAAFTQKATTKAANLAARQTSRIARLCADRIVQRDIMPALEAARKKQMTVADLEKSFSENIEKDEGLLKIVEEETAALRKDIQNNLNFSFRSWLKENGVLLAPRFDFPAQAIGQDFFDNISVKISRLDSLNIMNFTLTKIVPLLAATATAGAIAHTAEPISTVIGGGVALGATWLAAKTAPRLLEKRKLPSFFLNDANRAKIVKKNRIHIEETLRKTLADGEAKMEADLERRIKNSLVSMVNRLGVLNQIKTR